MKKLYSFIIVASILLIVGCAARQVVTPAVPAQPAITNATTGVVTPAVPGVPAVVTYVPNATVTQGVALGNQALPFIPAPYNGAVGALLSLSTLIAGFVAARKNGQLKTANDVSTAIIQGVESAGTAAAAVKTAIATVAKANGVADHVEAAVNKVVGSQ